MTPNRLTPTDNNRPPTGPADWIPHSRPMVGAEEARAAAEVVASGNLAEGEVTAAFEGALAGYLGLPHAVALGSGTAALCLTLAALGIGPGDEVIIPSFVCAALLNAVEHTGAAAVPADIDPRTLNIDPADVRRRLTARTKAVVVPHMFGLAADMDALLGLGVPIVEDCAQAVGGSRGGRPLGALGAAAVFSFYATKVMTTGEGGMIATRSGKLAQRVRDLKGTDGRPDHRQRYNFKLTEMQAAIGLVQLSRLPGFIDRRREIARRYAQALRHLPVDLPPEDPDHIFFRFVIRLGRGAGEFLRRARARGIACERPVFRPLHRLLGLDGYPATEQAFRRCVSIPIYPALSDRQVERIAAAVAESLPRTRRRQ
jgi:dTDP-4-amino-4,6-dideoxygalactose transaminase